MVEDGPGLHLAKQIVEEELARREEQVRKRIFKALQEGRELSGAEAIQGWMSLFHLDSIRKSLGSREKALGRASEQAGYDINRRE